MDLLQQRQKAELHVGRVCDVISESIHRALTFDSFVGNVCSWADNDIKKINTAFCTNHIMLKSGYFSEYSSTN